MGTKRTLTLTLPLGVRHTLQPFSPQFIVHLPPVALDNRERLEARVRAAELNLAEEREHLLLRVLHAARREALGVHARLQAPYVHPHVF